MFGKFSEQLKSTTKPVHTLFAVNTKTLESLSQHQTTLFTGLLSDSVRYIEAVSKQTEFKGVMTANSELAESVRERMTSASKDTYSTLNAMREEMTEVMAASLSTVAEETKESVDKATSAVKKTTKAATPKAAPKATEAPVKAAETVADATKETVDKAAEQTKAVAEKAKDATAEAKPATAAKKPATRTRRTTAKKSATTTKSTS